MTPYEALYHHKPSYGLSDFGIPVEHASHVHIEQELDALIEEINAPLTEDIVSNVSPYPTSPSKITPDIPTNSYDVRKEGVRIDYMTACWYQQQRSFVQRISATI